MHAGVSSDTIIYIRIYYKLFLFVFYFYMLQIILHVLYSYLLAVIVVGEKNEKEDLRM